MRKLQRWQEAFGEDKVIYEQWLEHVGLCEAEVFSLLNESSESLYARTQEKPAWIRTFEVAFAPIEGQPDAFLQEFLAASRKGEQGDLRLLLTAVEPLLRLGYQRFLSGLHALQQQLPGLAVEESALVSSLLTTLQEQLLRLMSRTLVLEFRIAQQQGLLAEGEDVTACLRAYAHLLRDRNTVLAFFNEYPVLARQVTRCVEQWCESNLEVLTRLFRDWPDLQHRYGKTGDPGALYQFQSTLGDTHQGGRSVCMLHFTSGFRLVYKPRSLAVDQHFQEFLGWLNAHGQKPCFYQLRVLDRERYGWVEWVEARECASSNEIERFYLRQGGYLAILYALGAVDFHFENILAAGEHPVLVDLESLLHVHSEPPTSLLNSAERQAYENIASSVLNTLLLPYRAVIGEEDARVDMSGLGGKAGQVIPRRALRLSGFETGKLRYIRDQAVLAGGKNRPTLRGQEVMVSAYLPQIITGFTDTYHLLLARRAELLTEQSPLSAFASDTTRVIFRATSSYALLLRACFHPYLLRHGLDRERVLNQLWRTVGARPHMQQLISWEQEDLRQGDIPFFTTQIQSRDLWTSSGQRLPNFFAYSGWELLQQRWNKLNEQDLARQIWFIQAAFATLAEGEQTWEQEPSLRVPREAEEQIRPLEVENAACLAAARNIGERICQLSFGEEHGATWVGLMQSGREQWTLAVADINLYNGLAGILLALAYLGKLTGNALYTQVARAAYVTVQKSITEHQHELTTIGFFSGWGGILAMQAHLAVLWQNEAPLRDAAQILDMLPPLIARDEHLDIISGSAGCLAGLLCLESVVPSQQISTLLKQCGERLAETAISLPAGKGWPVFQTREPLTGFAHGAAGFAWALLRLAQHSDDARFLRLAQEALAYERSLYSPERQNWQDVRGAIREQNPRYSVAWCYGAPGIGLARLDTLDIYTDESVHAEIEAAVETTATSGFGSNHSLCHGDLGNLELLYRAQRALPGSRWRSMYELRKATLLEYGRQQGWRCGTPHQVETPGLMVGLAGICLQLLRLAQPDCVPSLLSMAAPSPTSS